MEKSYLSERHRRVLSVVMGVLLLASMLAVGKEVALCLAGTNELPSSWQELRALIAGQELVSASATIKEQGICVVIDAGHGGSDPGKVGQNEILEKDINLQIAERVKAYLEANDIRVVMTRESDEMLGQDESSSSKKMQDMRARVNLIEENQPALVVSVHQNSYPSPEVHGAQVFYYQGSTEGSRLAELLQTSLITLVDPENTRQIKADSSYYLLKNVSVPMVIVECGFLTNPEEAAKLTQEEFQDRIAWAIHMGILQYLTDCF